MSAPHCCNNNNNNSNSDSAYGCGKCSQYHGDSHDDYQHGACCGREDKCMTKRCFGKRLLIASGDLTGNKYPWDDLVDNCEVGLARRLFIAIMEACDLYEDCDYQFTSAAYEETLQSNQTPGASYQSRHIDATLSVAASVTYVQAALFTIPFVGDSVVSTTNTNMSMAVNKGSPCAQQLIYVFERGLERIIENGVYANLILKYGGDLPAEDVPWTTLPTEETHPELFAIINTGRALESCHSHKLCRKPLLIGLNRQYALPWSNVDPITLEDTGLMIAIFRTIMRHQGFREGCDYHFVKFDSDQMFQTNGVGQPTLEGEAIATDYLDAALPFEIGKPGVNAAMFGLPVNDESDVRGLSLAINKKSHRALELQRRWNRGLLRLICSGEYQCLVEELGDETVNAWEVPPTHKTHPELYAMCRAKDCGDDYCIDNDAPSDAESDCADDDDDAATAP